MSCSLGKRLLAQPLAAVAALGLLACTGSGDGGRGLTDDFLATGALFESNPEPPGSSANPWVGLQQSVDQRTSFCLAVEVHRVVDLYSVTFTLAFDPTQARFRGSTTGLFLGTGLLESLDASTPGEIKLGLSRSLATHGMTGVSGAEGVLIELCFDVIGDGDDRGVDFIPNLALEDPAGAPVGATTWVGGSLTTRT